MLRLINDWLRLTSAVPYCASYIIAITAYDKSFEKVGWLQNWGFLET